jgi:hypothetical protein
MAGESRELGPQDRGYAEPRRRRRSAANLCPSPGGHQGERRSRPGGYRRGRTDRVGQSGTARCARPGAASTQAPARAAGDPHAKSATSKMTLRRRALNRMFGKCQLSAPTVRLRLHSRQGRADPLPARHAVPRHGLATGTVVPRSRKLFRRNWVTTRTVRRAGKIATWVAEPVLMNVPGASGRLLIRPSWRRSRARSAPVTPRRGLAGPCLATLPKPRPPWS